MSRCKEHVHDDYGVGFHPCLRKAQEGSDYCKLHDPDERKRRQEERDSALRKKFEASLKKQRQDNIAIRYHQRLVDALRKQVKSMNCICKFLTYTGDEPPCTTCKLRALLAEIDKEEPHGTNHE